jgi:regulation of enolase protein 1 (concanavalin A-like superfamily)
MKLHKYILLTILIFQMLCAPVIYADGKLLRSEKWQKFSVEGKAADFYVSADGNDQWSGTLAKANDDQTDGPFATLLRAQRAVRELKAKVYFPKDDPIETRWIGSPHPLGKGKDILVLIRGGHYYLSEPLLFEPQDGGERVETNLPTGAFEYHKLKDHYVTYAAYPGETPILVGGKAVDGWRKENNVWKTKINADEATMLVIDGKKQVLARTPNSGYFTPPKISTATNELFFRPNELKQWDEMEGNRIHMLLRWHGGTNSIDHIDEKKSVAYFKEEQPGIIIVPPRYYVENVEALLDAPGEWFFKKSSGEMSWIANKEISSPQNIHAVIPQLKELINVRGERSTPVRNLRFYGLQIEGAKAGGRAVSFEYAHACEIADSKFHALAGMAMYVGKGCYQTRILNNTAFQVDAMVITVDGVPFPENSKDIIHETTIERNRFDDCGGVNIEAHNSLFTTISRNEISNTRGRYAISVGGWANLEDAIEGGYRVEYNHIYHAQKLADDSGVIKTAGLAFDSIVRGNVIHDVVGGYFNDNVGFWFDNMSSGWLSEENIFYNLEQGEMKLCAAHLSDNIYRNNFRIETPEHAPESIIDGIPDFHYDDLKIQSENSHSLRQMESGTLLTISAKISNIGSTGMLPVRLFVDGRIASTQLFPVISKNSRRIQFKMHIYEPGSHSLAIGTTSSQSIEITGQQTPIVFENISVSHPLAPAGENVRVHVNAINRSGQNRDINANLMLNKKVIESQKAAVAVGDTVQLTFTVKPPAGRHTLQVNNSPIETIEVFELAAQKLKMKNAKIYSSGRAKPFDVKIKKDKVSITASGSDFYHAEDSYATAYFPKVKGNFVATVKVNGFGERTHEWFRAGLFARNDIEQSYDVAPGSLGSVLYFTTPGRAGIQWDEFADGCMHKASSSNLPEDVKYPLWLKLVRHGDSFSGYVSFDGETWTREKQTRPVPGLNEAIDIGLAGGSCDKNQYQVEFEDFKLVVEK